MEEEKHTIHHKEKPDEEKHPHASPHTSEHHTSSKKPRLSKEGYQKLFIALGTVLVVIVIFNIVQISALGSVVDVRIAEVEEAAKPAKLELVTITAADCEDCQDITLLIESIKNANTEILSENNFDVSSEQAQELVNKYGLERVPTLLLFGEIDKFNARELEERDDALIFTQAKPPYANAVTGEIMGKVSTIILKDSFCSQCSDLSSISDTLRQSGVVLEEEKVITQTDARAEKFIERLDLKRLPVLLISDDIEVYPFVEKIRQTDFQLKDGHYIIEGPPPYVEIQTGEVRGLVDLTMITDDLCDNCYDVNLHKNVFASIGLAIEGENTVDINSAEGIMLRIQYQLEKVPTVILGGDLEAYPNLKEFWTQRMGTVEDDGAYVFRSLEAVGAPFRDLTEGGTTS